MSKKTAATAKKPVASKKKAPARAEATKDKRRLAVPSRVVLVTRGKKGTALAARISPAIEDGVREAAVIARSLGQDDATCSSIIRDGIEAEARKIFKLAGRPWPGDSRTPAPSEEQALASA